MRDMELLVLGSGGPFAQPSRASSSYVVFSQGQPRLLVDCGGGAFERLGRAGVDPGALGTVLLTHTHADHTGGLPAVVFASVMAGGAAPLTVVGPAGRDQHPGCRHFTDLLFGPSGAWSYLHTFDGFGIDAHEVASDPGQAQVRDVLSLPGLTVRAVAVSHGMMPSLAYRIDSADAALVLSGDVDGASPGLVELARGADLLVHDMALPERDVPHGGLHAKPRQVGRTAASAGVRALLLTHVMPELEDEREVAEQQVRTAYPGPVSWAHDLLRIPVRGR